MKTKLFNALSLAVIMAMLFTSLALADSFNADADALVLATPHANSLSATQNGGTTVAYDFSAYVKNTGNASDNVFPGTVTVTISRSGAWLDASSGSPASFSFTAYDSAQAGTVRISVPCGAQGATQTMTVVLDPGTSTNGETLNPDSISLSYTITAGLNDPSCAPPPPSNTAPSVSVTGITNGASYNKGFVPTALCDVTDTEDGPSTFAATLSAITGPFANDGIGEQTASCFYEDDGGLSDSVSMTYYIVDPFAPEIDYALVPPTPDGSNDWYKSDVTLTWTVIDPESTVTKTGCEDQNIIADQWPATYSCSASSAGGSAGPVTVTVKRDGTAPIITASRTPEANANGWNNTNVTANYEASDATSGLDVDSPETGLFTFNSEGAGQSHTFTVTDFAGNSASATVNDVNIDMTAPTISFVGPSTASWYMADVTANWNCSDVLSEPVSASVSATTSGEGSAVAVTGTCTDKAGNTASDTRSFMVDKTAPVVAVTGVVNGAVYTLGSVPAAGCSTTDALSGVATYASLSSSGGPVGFITATCSGAFDNAGNAGNTATATYQVIYNWTGFFQPVDNNALNTVKAGSAVPVKFSLGGNQGFNIFMTGYPKFVKTSCTTGLPEDAIETTVTAGGSSLTYDALAGQYIYVWKTEKLWVGWCGQLQVNLIDGTTHTALFKLK